MNLSWQRSAMQGIEPGTATYDAVTLPLHYSSGRVLKIILLFIQLLIRIRDNAMFTLTIE